MSQKRSSSRASVRSAFETKKPAQPLEKVKGGLQVSSAGALHIWNRKSSKNKSKNKSLKSVRKGKGFRSLPLHPSLRKFIKNFSGDVDPTDEGFQAGLQMAQSLVDPGTIYRFRLTHFKSHTTSVGGVLAEVLNNDPSTWQEWSSLSSLFTQVRIRRATLHVHRALQASVPTTTSYGNCLPLAFNAMYDEVAAPTTYDTCTDTPNYKIFDHYFATKGMTITLDFTGATTPLWADVSTPQSSSLFQGCPGCFQLYADNQFVSTVIACSFQTLDLEFMNRF
jgi:hypothetical protein